MAIFDKPDYWVPDNNEQFDYYSKNYDDIIIRGGTCQHVFILPIVVGASDSLEVIYTQGLNKIITRVPNSYTISNDNTTTVTINLSETETLKFTSVGNELAKAQISIVFGSTGAKSFSDIKKFKVIQTLENM